MKNYSISLLFFFIFFMSYSVKAQRITVTVAGNGFAGYSGDGLPGKQAQINGSQYITSDYNGNLYFLDGGRVRMVSVKTGIISTIGGGGTSTADGVPATTASISAQCICANAIGDIYLGSNFKIRKIDGSTGVISTIAGTTYGYGGDGGPATSALFRGITDICTDAIGNIYIVDKYDCRIRKITTSTGIITTLGGIGSPGYTGDGGPATNARLNDPTYICCNPIGDIYFTDQSLTYIRRIIATSGVISTYAGGGSGLTHCLASITMLGPVSGLRFDAAYNLCFNELSCSCRKIDHFTDSVEYIGGDYATESFKDDTNSLYAWMNYQQGITTDTNDNIFIADHGNNRIRKLIKLTHNPTFAYGRGQSINPCPGYGYPLNLQLAITDLDSGQTENWTVVSAPAHGTLTGFPVSAISKGKFKTAVPSGLSYSAPSSYTGVDSFVVAVSDGSLTDTAVVYVSVQMASTGTISGTTSVCTGLTTHLAETLTGGRWSTTNSNATIDSISGIVQGITAGTDTVIYNIVAPCPITTFVPITINGTPSAGTITGVDTVCVGATATYTESVSGGSWSSLVPSRATIDASTGVVTGLNYSTSTITYTVSTSYCTATATKPIFVNTPAYSIVGASSLCSGAVTTYSNAIPGGAWSLSNSRAAISGTTASTASVTGSSPGNDTVYYTNTNSCGTATVSKEISVVSPPSTGTISGPSAVCIGSTITLSSSVSGGDWSRLNTHASVGIFSGVVTGISSGTDSIIYTITGSFCSASTGILITISPAPSAGTITGPTNACIGSSVSLIDAATGGTWSASNSHASVSGSGVVSAITAGRDSIRYSVSNACGTATATATITIDSGTYAGIITGPSGVCAGSYVALSDAVSGGSWSVSNPHATISATGIVSGVTAGSDSVLYTFSNACGTATTSNVITINPLPDAGTITAPTSVCMGSTITANDAVAGGCWSTSNSHASASASGVITGVTAGTDSILYFVTNSCGTAEAVHVITINPSPDAGTITGPDNVCIGSSILLENSSIGGIWSVSNPKATISGTGLVTGSLSGLDTIKYTVTNLCGTAVTEQTIYIVNCHPEGIQSSGMMSSIKIFPNPASSVIAIEWSTLSLLEAEILLTDNLGRVVLKCELHDNAKHSKQLDLSALDAGIYLLTLRSGTEYSTTKIVVEK